MAEWEETIAAQEFQITEMEQEIHSKKWYPGTYETLDAKILRILDKKVSHLKWKKEKGKS